MIPRQIPDQSWYMQSVFSVVIGGILPFGAVFIELFFILSSVWLNQFYYVFGFLALVVLILVITCSEISIVLVYFQLCSEVRSDPSTNTATILYHSLYHRPATSRARRLFVFSCGVVDSSALLTHVFWRCCVLHVAPAGLQLVVAVDAHSWLLWSVSFRLRYLLLPDKARHHRFHFGIDVLRLHVLSILCVRCGYWNNWFHL